MYIHIQIIEFTLKAMDSLNPNSKYTHLFMTKQKIEFNLKINLKFGPIIKSWNQAENWICSTKCNFKFEPKSSKDDFNSPKKIGPQNDSSDPLSQLDPLWSLKWFSKTKLAFQRAPWTRLDLAATAGHVVSAILT